MNSIWQFLCLACLLIAFLAERDARRMQSQLERAIDVNQKLIAAMTYLGLV